MMRFSVQLRDRILVKGHGFLSFYENDRKNVGKKINKSLSSKYSQKHDRPKRFAVDTLKTTSKKSNLK